MRCNTLPLEFSRERGRRQSVSRLGIEYTVHRLSIVHNTRSLNYNISTHINSNLRLVPGVDVFYLNIWMRSLITYSWSLDDFFFFSEIDIDI